MAVEKPKGPGPLGKRQGRNDTMPDDIGKWIADQFAEQFGEKILTELIMPKIKMSTLRNVLPIELVLNLTHIKLFFFT